MFSALKQTIYKTNKQKNIVKINKNVINFLIWMIILINNKKYFKLFKKIFKINGFLNKK